MAENGTVVAGWGFWLALIGLVLTLAGFGITWAQLKKTKSAAEAVSLEIARIKLSIAIYDAAQEASRAISALDSAKCHLRNKAWSDVADSYDGFRRAILNVTSLQVLDPEVHIAVEEANKYVAKLCERIELGLVAGRIDVNEAKTITMIRHHDELAGLISLALQKGVLQ